MSSPQVIATVVVFVGVLAFGLWWSLSRLSPEVRKPTKPAASTKKTKPSEKKAVKKVEPEPEPEAAEEPEEEEEKPVAKPAPKPVAAKKAAPTPAPAPKPKAAPTPAAKAPAKAAATPAPVKAAPAPAKAAATPAPAAKKAAAPTPAAAPAPAAAPKETKKAAPAPAAAAPAASAEEKLSKGQKKRSRAKDKKAATVEAAEAETEEAEAVALVAAAQEIEEAKIQARLAAEGWQTQPVSRKTRVAEANKAAAAAAAKLPKPDKTEGPACAIDVPVPADLHGLIIGPKGEHLKRLQEATGTKITMPKQGGGITLLVEGDDAGCARARAALNDIVKKGYSPLLMPVGSISVEVSIPDEKLVGRIIGPSGAYIKSIQDKYNVKVVMPDKAAAHPKVTLMGATENCKKARDVIRELINQGYSAITHPNWSKIEIPVHKDDLKFLIGPKGQTIKSIQGNTKTRINIPKPEDANQNVVVVGPASGVIQAEKEIRRALEPAPEEEADEEEADPAWTSVAREEVW